ncbi:MAG: Omp28-related outer membrane protein [Crocinitomix sp.]|nr:Omp28-related outer membrane protein [Crocinitomix sp.]
MTKNKLILGALALGLSVGAFAQAEKFVVLEEKTGTWCGWCPYGTVEFAILEDDEPNFIGIAVHNSDPMEVTSYDDQSAASFPGFGGYPYAVADRIEGDHAAYAGVGFATRETETPVAAIDVHGYISGDQLEIRILCQFDSQQTGDWRLAGVVTEDGVTGTGSGYAQANYFSGGSPLTGAGHDWQAEPNPVPAADMVYDHVARALGDDELNGVDASLPATMSTGVNYWYSYYVDIDPEWDLNNIHVVAMLVEPSGTINNAGKGDVASGEVGTVGLEEAAANTFAITAFPNPASEFVNLTVDLQEASSVSIEVINMLGAVVSTIETQNLAIGTHYNEINVAHLTEGVYFIKTTVNETLEMTKIVVQ